MVSEVDENGEPYLPRFFVSRIYIDMTESLYATNFEQLLRWLYDKPQHVKPALGKMPEFLNENRAPSLTRGKVRQSIAAMQNSAVNPAAATNSYLDSLVEVLERSRIDPQSKDFSQAVLDNIENFLPYWYPETLLYTVYRFRPPFEVFARSESKAYFKRFSPVLGVKNKEEMHSLLAKFSRDGMTGHRIPSWEFETLDIAGLAHVAKLETQP